MERGEEAFSAMFKALDFARSEARRMACVRSGGLWYAWFCEDVSHHSSKPWKLTGTLCVHQIQTCLVCGKPMHLQVETLDYDPNEKYDVKE